MSPEWRSNLEPLTGVISGKQTLECFSLMGHFDPAEAMNDMGS
jgi:hypothetical protein